ncbi:hypothetical protein BASA62_006708 [Batrachochytrium salamandrivorans]|nr:hypothetical protein BASA62_006708 [Batrachochytrium salamandrivorans]
MTAAGVILSGGSVRVYSNSPTRLDSSSLPGIAVETECVGKRIVTSRVRVRKPCGWRIMTAAAAVLMDGEAEICSNGPTREHYSDTTQITIDKTVYHSNLDVLAASAISDAVDCLKCPTALLQLCNIALDDGPLLLPAWLLKGVNIEHFPTPVHLTSNIPPASSTVTTDMAISAPAATAKQGSTAARSKKAASIKQGDSSTAPISNSVIDPEKEDASSLTGKRTRKDGGVPTQRKRACKVAVQPVVEKLSGPKERLETKEENKQIGSASAVRRPYRTSKKPANTLATAGDTMPTEDELKAMTYIVSSLRIVPHSSEVFEIHSTNLTCLSGSNSSTMKCTEKIKDETVGLLLTLNGVGSKSLDLYLDAIESKQFASASQFRVTLLMDLRTIEATLDADGEAGDHLRRTLVKLSKLFGSLWEFYFPLVDDISQRNSGRSRCNARSDLGLALAAAAPPSLSSLPARLKNKRAAAELTDSDAAAPKRLCKS